MPAVQDRDLVTIGPWPRGANNIAREDAVPAGSFRKGINVDVYPDGNVRRRKGNTSYEPTPTANLWCGDGHYALCTSLDSTTLYRFTPGLTLTPLFSGLTPESEISYCTVNNYIRVSDGATALRIDTSDDSVRAWSIDSPAGAPQLTVELGNGLDPGMYQVALSYAAADGEESGAVAASIDLPLGGGIRVQAPAMPVPMSVTRINLYVTRPGGSDFLLYGSYPIGALDVSIGPQTLGRPLRTLNLSPMPAGNASVLIGGKLAVVVDNLLIWSEHGFGLTNLAKNYVAYAGAIDMCAPTVLGAAADGVFIAAGDKTYFLTGPSLKDANSRLAYASGAVPGAPKYISGDSLDPKLGFPSQPLPAWLSRSGQVCVGLPTGQVYALTAGRYAMRSGDRVQIEQRELEGIDQIVVNVRSPGPASIATTGDSADSILVRNGVVIP